MARKPRIEFEGAFYHVITRGNQKQIIFKDDEDREKFLEILSHYKERHMYQLYAYVLMTNHVHLLVETKDSPLSKIMQGVNQSYTAYFNKKYETVGHLFQGRYKAILCDRNEYLLALVKYIHENPLRAKVVKSLSEYPWSSHLIYEKKKPDNTLVDTDQVLRMFSENKSKARLLYKAFIDRKEMVSKEAVYTTIDQRVLGGEHFVEKVIEKTKGHLNKKQPEKAYPLAAIAKAIEDVLKISIVRLRAKNKEPAAVKAKKIFCLIAHEYGYSGKETARFIEKDPAIVSRYIKQEKADFAEVELVIKALKRENVNSQV